MARVVTGREDIELAVAASGLVIGGRVTMTGAITWLTADSKGRVWMRVRLDGGSHVDCAPEDIGAGEHKSPARADHNEGGSK